MLLLCPLLLTLDLGQPVRFWHMLIDSRTAGLAFKYWSPMSVGAWALLLFGVFSTVMFAAALGEGAAARNRTLMLTARIVSRPVGRVFMVVGAVFGVFVAAYTGVLLAVSNQPVWSDSWTLGGLFLASGLSGATAVVLLVGSRREASETHDKLIEADRYFVILELVLIALFFITLGAVLSRVLSGGWLLLWLVVLLGTVAPLVIHLRPDWRQRISPALTPILVLLGVIALRAVVIFSAQT